MVGKEVARPRGKLTPYAFFVQICREEHKRKYPEEKVDFAEFSKKCADRWKTMSDIEKKRFTMLAESDKRRFDLEMKTFSASNPGKRTKKEAKDPNAPKRPMTAYLSYATAVREETRAAHPSISFGEISKVIAQQWGALEAEEKEEYEKMAQEAKTKYQEAKALYDTQGGGED